MYWPEDETVEVLGVLGAENGVQRPGERMQAFGAPGRISQEWLETS